MSARTSRLTDADRTGGAALRRFFRRVENRFSRTEPREHAYAYLCHLLSQPVETRAGWEDGRNRLLTTSRWDEDGVRDLVRDTVVEHLGSPEGALVLAEEGFLKKGRHSAGVEWQHCAASNRTDNYQIGVFLLYADRHGTASAIDRELLLPPSWTRGTVRRERAGVPAEAGARARDELALAMLDRAFAARVPARWVLADTPGFGDSARLRAALEARRTPYVLACAESGHSPRVPLENGFVRWRTPRWGGGSYVAFLPWTAGHDRLVEAAETGAAAGLALGSARQEAGLGRYTVRQWRAWYRHMTLAMFAHACLTVSRGRTAPGPASRAG
ncbi:IS701 family transposase [Streptomyces sp. NPDC048172]|uniref:IS701 family transposase n=1 Tax=Streptomyces sp. NPDC048172 TaxID=3365505 RepID=UPI0037211CD1